MPDSSISRDTALIGAGYWGRNLARNLHALGRLHTICDPSAVVLNQFGPDYSPAVKTMDFGQVLSNPEITRVAIAVPAILHFELAKAALEAGKDVFVEKPLCLDVQDAEILVSLADKLSRILMVGHLLQYHPCIRRIKSLLAEGTLGRLQYITSNRLNLGKFRREENALWSFAPHDLSVILSLAGGRLPEQVRCVGEAYLNTGVCDTTLTSLKFSGGVRAHVYVSWLNPFKEQKLTVVGSQGMLVFDDTLPWPEKLRLHRDYLKWTDGNLPVPAKAACETLTVEEMEPLLEECRHFLECCDSRRAPRTDGAEGIRVLRVLRAAQESLEQDGKAARPSMASQSAKSADFEVHPTALADPGARIGTGTRVWHFGHVSAGARLGRNCSLGQNSFVAPGVVIGDNVKIQNNVSIYEGVEIENDVFLGPSCVLTNVSNPRSQINRKGCYEKTRIKRGATVGANATVVCGVTLGRYCFIAAGAVVTRDVPDYALMRGNPARRAGWMSRHGHVLKPDEDGLMTCPESGLRYQECDPGRVRCLDLEEEAPLPEDMCKGRQTYREIKATQLPGQTTFGPSH